MLCELCQREITDISGHEPGCSLWVSDSGERNRVYPDDDNPEIKTLQGGRKYLVIYEPGSRHVSKVEMSIEQAQRLIPQLESLLETV